MLQSSHHPARTRLAMMPSATGLALLSVIILMLLLALVGAAAMYTARSQFALLEDQVRREQAYYCVEAGVQHGLWRLRTGMDPNGETLNFNLDGRTFVVTLSTAPGPAGATQVSASVNY